MTATPAGYLLRYLRHLPSDRDRAAGDADLMTRFAESRDEAAFAELLRRHGRLVWSVCRRVLGDAHAAEDAFQATFLLLARRAAGLRRPSSLAGWLHGAAWRLARQARRGEERRHRRERCHARPEAAPAEDVSWREVRQILDAELARLPRHYREPLILCYLEGLTQAEAARRLGCGEAALHGRLERGRQALRRRLVRRGLSDAAPLLLPLAADFVPPSLREVTLTTVSMAAAGGPVAPAVSSLVTNASGYFGVAKWKIAVGLLLLVSAVGLGVAGAGYPRADPLAQAVPRVVARPAAPPAEVPQERVDALGDPLPPDALLRMGTLRQRVLDLTGQYRRPSVPLPPDGKTRLRCTDEEVCWVDRATERTTATWPLPKGLRVCGFSADGRLMLLTDALTDSQTDHRTLRLWDLPARKELRVFEDKGSLGSGEIASFFSPDNKLVLTHHGTKGLHQGLIRVWDVATGRHLWQEGVMGVLNRGQWPVGFLADSKTLAIRELTTNRVCLRDPATGKEQRSLVLPPELGRMALSPDTKTVMADTYGTTVRAWDLATGKELPSLGEHESKVAPKRTMFAFSPDGKTVLTSEINDTFIQVWDWPAAKLRRKINYRTGGIRTMEIDAEGKQANILFVGQNALRSFDLETGKELPPVLAAAHRAPVHGLAVAPDGKVVSAALDNSIRVWDLRTGKQLHEHGVDLINGSSSLALSGDGVLVAVVNTKISRGTVALHERETGRMVRTIETGPLVDLVSHLAFAPEGRLLAVSGVETGPRGRGDRRPFLALWDAESGRELRRLPGAGRDKLCFNPDGRLLAVLSGGQVRLWEVATGRERPALPLSGLSAHAFSPDGRTLALAYRKGIILWELAAGKERGRIEAPLQRARSLAFSPDGRWLACDSDRAVVLCDVWSGQIIHTFNGHASEVPGLAFAPDGRSLVSSSIDTTLLVWDVAGVVARQAKPRPQPDTTAVTAAWADLASTDAQAAYRAINVLGAAPGLSLPLLRERVLPDSAPDGKQVARWLAQLGGEDFEERQRATKELARLGEQAEAELRRFLASNPPLEARRRAEELLDQLARPLTDPEWLRRLRAVETLERIGTAEARGLLQTLAEGAAASRITRESKASLDRLNRWPGTH